MKLVFFQDCILGYTSNLERPPAIPTFSQFPKCPISWDKKQFSNCKVAKGNHVLFEIPSTPGLLTVAAHLNSLGSTFLDNLNQ